MTIQRMDDVGVVVADLAAATAFFAEAERYGDSDRLCCVRGPAGIILEPARRIG